MKKHSILIVEDEMLVRGGLKAMIGWDKLDIEVCGDAENGAEALKIYEKFHPDIILTDIRMPVDHPGKGQQSKNYFPDLLRRIFLSAGCHEAGRV